MLRQYFYTQHLMRRIVVEMDDEVERAPGETLEQMAEEAAKQGEACPWAAVIIDTIEDTLEVD